MYIPQYYNQTDKHGFPNLGNTCFINCSLQMLRVINTYNSFVHYQEDKISQYLNELFNTADYSVKVSKIKQLVNTLDFKERISIPSKRGGDPFNNLNKQKQNDLDFNMLFNEVINFKQIISHSFKQQNLLYYLFSYIFAKGLFCQHCLMFNENYQYIEVFEVIHNIRFFKNNDKRTLQSYFTQLNDNKNESQYKCQICKRKLFKDYACFIKCPDILLINFDSSQPSERIDNTLKILDLSKNKKIDYKLIGIINYEDFHYTFQGQSFNENDWKLYNDSKVQDLSEPQKMNSKIVIYKIDTSNKQQKDYTANSKFEQQEQENYLKQLQNTNQKELQILSLKNQREVNIIKNELQITDQNDQNQNLKNKILNSISVTKRLLQQIQQNSKFLEYLSIQQQKMFQEFIDNENEDLQIQLFKKCFSLHIDDTFLLQSDEQFLNIIEEIKPKNIRKYEYGDELFQELEKQTYPNNYHLFVLVEQEDKFCLHCQKFKNNSHNCKLYKTHFILEENVQKLTQENVNSIFKIQLDQKNVKLCNNLYHNGYEKKTIIKFPQILIIKIPQNSNPTQFEIDSILKIDKTEYTLLSIMSTENNKNFNLQDSKNKKIKIQMSQLKLLIYAQLQSDQNISKSSILNEKQFVAIVSFQIIQELFSNIKLTQNSQLQIIKQQTPDFYKINKFMKEYENDTIMETIFAFFQNDQRQIKENVVNYHDPCYFSLEFTHYCFKKQNEYFLKQLASQQFYRVSGKNDEFEDEILSQYKSICTSCQRQIQTQIITYPDYILIEIEEKLHKFVKMFYLKNKLFKLVGYVFKLNNEYCYEKVQNNNRDCSIIKIMVFKRYLLY